MSGAERYQRQSMLPLYEQQGGNALRSKKVGVIGVGGVGGVCSLLLATAGVGEIRIADGDEVEIHNLHRQLLFREQDVGSSKAKRAAEALAEHQSESKIVCFPCMIDESNFAEFTAGLDLLIDASDSAQSRLNISNLALQAQLPLLSGAVSAYTAMIALFAYDDKAWVQKHGCYRCLTQGFLVPTFKGITGPLASTVASLTAHIALESMLGSTEMQGKALFCDLKTMRLQKITLTHDNTCPACRGREA